MNNKGQTAISLVVSGLLVLSVRAFADDAPDKAQFNLLHPTLVEFMRELSPDRPDKTECPYTVDAGHVQLEMDFANFTSDRTSGTTTRAWNITPINFKVGLFNNVDLQLIFDSYLQVHTENSVGKTATQSGVGDFTIRTKINLWGNEGRGTAFALLPFLKFPTSTGGLGNNSIEGGLILPLAIPLPQSFDLGLETGASFMRNGSDREYHAEFINSITLGHPIVGNLSAYVEFFSNVSTERKSDWQGTADVGFMYAIGKNMELDCGCNFGITSAADDWNPFAGVTMRF